MSTDDFVFEVAARNGDPHRLVIAKVGDEGFHRGKVDTDSAHSRGLFFKQLAKKAEVEAADLVKQFDQRIVHLADQADAQAEADAGSPGESDSEEERPCKSQATILVEMVLEAGVVLFHDPDGTTYAQFAVDDHVEIARVNSGSFKKWIARLYHEKTGKAPNSQAKADAAGVLEGVALYDGDERPVFVRLAEHDGRIYLDLCNEKWQAVEIDANGWRIIDRPPVMFRRAKAMLPLPAPIEGGEIELLQSFISTEKNAFILIISWLISALRPGRPYPILELDGEQGSGKSTKAKMLRSLIDPNTADLRSEPREPRDLMIAASNGHVVALDNLSHLPVWLSDCLCRLATGGGFSTRTLYENDEETIFSAIRPIILTGIEQVASRGDLIDRCLLVSLPSIPEHKRLPEADIWRDFEVARPMILGALLTAASSGLKNLKTTRLSALPRMADFAIWATACETSFSLQAGEFMAAYTGNRAEADVLAIESSLVGKILLAWLTDRGVDWEGTATELLTALESYAELDDPKARKPKGWPASPKSLSGAVKRIAPHLRKLGWEYSDRREPGGNRSRRVAFRKGTDFCVPSVPCVPNPQNPNDFGDAPGTHRDASGTQENDDRTHGTHGTQKNPPVLDGGEDDVCVI